MKTKFLIAVIAVIAASLQAPVKAQALPEPEALNTVYYYEKATHNMQVLEKSKATASSRLKGMKAEVSFNLDGTKAGLRLPSGSGVSFLLNEASGDPSTSYTLYKAEVNKKGRKAVMTNVGAFSGKAKGANNTIAYDVKKSGKAYELVAPALEKGEYFFIAMGSSPKYGGQAYDAFAFGID